MRGNWDAYPGRYAMRWIVDAALETTPKDGVWVEVGCGIGKGVAYMADALVRAGRDDIALYAVDPFGGYARNGEQQASGEKSRHGDWALFVRTMQTHAPEAFERLNILRMPSTYASACFMPCTVDLCVIDADHSYEAVRDDITAWWPTIALGGWIGGDDHTPEFPGVQKACEEFFGPEYEHEARENGWETWRKRR